MTVRKQIETQNLYTGSSDSLTFPLTRDLTHDLGDGRGETLLSQGFAKGAAAAYSLRALGSYNEPVVRVRREPHDNTAGIDDEINFSANQISSGVLEDWVNGKLEDTLPASEDEAQAIIISGGSEIADVYLSTSLTNGKPAYFSTTLSTQLKLVFTSSNPRWLLQRADNLQTFVASTSTGEDEAFPTKIQDLSTYFSGTGTKEITLITPASPAAAAYSLRKVKASYSGNAVRIRRSSDEVEVNVAFDSDDKVSANSLVTNISEQGGEIGSTTATDLSGFLSETKDVPKSYDHSADPTTSQNVYVNVGKYGASQPSTYDGDSNPDSLPTIPNGSRYATKWTSTNAAYGFSYGQPYNDDTYTVEFDILQKTGTQNVKFQNTNAMESYPQNNLIEGSLSNGQFTTKDQWVHYKMSFRTGATRNGGGLIRSGNTSVQTTWYIANFKITPTTDSDAFVHTWYDQAGSNNATQETATNQPKIAENGALLADGIEFDSDFLQTSSQVLTGTHTGANSMYVVVKQTSADNGYICGSTGSGGAGSRVGQSLFSSNTNDLVVLTDGTDGATDGTLDNIARLEGVEYLISANYSNNNTNTLKKNANNFGYANGTNAYTFSAGSTFSIGTFGNSTVSGNLFAGSMKEIIVYDSDQSDNRFKIESNINNYYGLYNDANEVTGAFTSSGAESFTANGTDGFTLTNSTFTAFGGIELNQVLTAGEKIYISFNLSIDAGSNTSPNLNIRESSITGGTASDEGFFVPTEGFNSTVFTSDSGGDARYISFGENDTDPSTYTISDFKVSRIARDGFVETWYDQSGNANNAVQATATEQPSIVKNGGIVKLNGKPSVDFNGVDNYFTFTNNFNFNLEPTSVSRPVNTIMFVGENTAGSRSFLGDKGSTKNWIAAPYNGRYQFRDNGSTIYDTTVSATLGSQLVLSIQCPSEDDFSIRENGSAKTLGGTNNITAAIGIRDIGAGYTLSGNANYQTMKAQEFYFHNERLTNDIVDIENDAINYYNIS